MHSIPSTAVAAIVTPLPLGEQLQRFPALLPSIAAGRRKGSFRALLGDPIARAQFFGAFLVDILPVVPPKEVSSGLGRRELQQRHEIALCVACVHGWRALGVTMVLLSHSLSH